MAPGLRALRPDVAVGFASYGPGPTSAFAGWLLADGLGVDVAAAAAFVFPVKVVLLTLPLAVGGLAAGAVARRLNRGEAAPGANSTPPPERLCHPAASTPRHSRRARWPSRGRSATTSCWP